MLEFSRNVLLAAWTSQSPDRPTKMHLALTQDGRERSRGPGEWVTSDPSWAEGHMVGHK